MSRSGVSGKNELNLWDALSVTFIVEKYFNIFPLKRQGNQMVYSPFACICTIISMLSYYVCIAFATYLLTMEMIATNEIKIKYPSAHHHDDGNFSKSYLMIVIALFEYTFTIVGVGTLILFSLFKQNKQLMFLQKIYDVDLVILNELQAHINYKRLRLTNYIAVITIFSYYIGLMCFVFYKLHALQFLTLGVFLTSLLYQFEQSTAAIVTWVYINFVMLIHNRFKIIRQLQEDVAKEKKIMKKNSIPVTDNVSKLSTLLMTYKELCSCIDALNEMSGSVLILRITHDFTLTTSQVYLISWIIMDNYDSNKFDLVLAIFMWMFQNIVKIGLTTLLTEITINEAKECSYTINKSNKSSDNEDIRCMLDSFDAWLLHHRIEFTANNFFKIDLTLLYAIIGALTSYVLILIQFKQQEETLTSGTNEMANQTKLHT